MKLLWLGNLEARIAAHWPRYDHDETDAAVAQEKVASGNYVYADDADQPQAVETALAAPEPAPEPEPEPAPEPPAAVVAPEPSTDVQAMQDAYSTTPAAAALGHTEVPPDAGDAKPRPAAPKAKH